MSQPVIFKEDTEILPVGWDYAPETVSSAVITIDPPGLDKEGSEVIGGSRVKQSVKNGTAGQFYEVIFEVTTHEGNIYIDKIFISVYSA